MKEGESACRGDKKEHTQTSIKGHPSQQSDLGELSLIYERKTK